MDSSDGLVDNKVYRAHEIIAHRYSGGQRAGEQEEMVYIFITAWTGVCRIEKRKCL
jgi:hypothetical protein